MYLRFQFKEDDALIRTKLNPTEIGAVKIWQVSDKYEFEFHTGHDTGFPLYIRPANNKDRSNLPKFDTLNKTGASYTQIEDLANGAKLKNELDSVARAEILNLLKNEWTTLSLLADRFWRGVNVVNEDEAEAKQLERWAHQEYVDDSGQHTDEISREDLRHPGLRRLVWCVSRGVPARRGRNGDVALYGRPWGQTEFK